MKKPAMLVLLIMLLSILGGCGDQGNPVVKTITSKNGSSKTDYSIVYDNGKIGKTDEFEPDEATFLFVENGDFKSSMDDGKITVTLDTTELTDEDGNPYETDDTLMALMESVANNAEHDIFDVKIIIDGDRYFVFEKHNVNFWTPCVLYEYYPADSKLTELYKWDDVELTGIALCGSAEIIGGADGPTSIYLAPETSGGSDKEVNRKKTEEAVYTGIIDRVLNEYKYEPVPWNNTIDWKENADILIEMAEDPTGRYKAYGIISREAGSYGIVLNDTIDGKDRNMNYVYEEWIYTGNEDGEPEFTWKDDELHFAYPIPVDSGFEIRTVGIDCGYDTGHMEFKVN